MTVSVHRAEARRKPDRMSVLHRLHAAPDRNDPFDRIRQDRAVRPVQHADIDNVKGFIRHVQPPDQRTYRIGQLFAFILKNSGGYLVTCFSAWNRVFTRLGGTFVLP